MKNRNKPEYAAYYRNRWYQRVLMQGILWFYYISTATVIILVLWAIFAFYVKR
jgi:hypothetical protein